MTLDGSLIWAAKKRLTANWLEHRFRFEVSLNFGTGPVFCFWYSLAWDFLFHFQKAVAAFWAVEEFEG
ncbi:MAG: hypothetical protein AMR96_01020 [Candidatus Adiutrix intracellularis]|nr:MAG: hypothetical protein AMR96_01020 [Candidatus Adiutrix intracellularis]